jgi:membrane protein
MTVTCVIDKIEKSGSTDLHFEETEDIRKIRTILDDFHKRQVELPSNILLKDL